MVFSFTKTRSFVRDHFSVSQLEHTYSFIHARNFLGIELSFAEENVLIVHLLTKMGDIVRVIHLHPRIEEHRATAVGAHLKGWHEISNPELLKQFSVLKEMPGKAWLPHQRNAFHPYEETEVEHTIELNSRESICLEHFNARALIRWLTI